MIEKINQTNYEAFFLDYLEGNLTTGQQKELDRFLEENPELKAELEEFEMISLEEEQIVDSTLKDSLKREESTGLLFSDYLMIAEVEGTISKSEKASLSELVQQDASLMDDLAMYHKTKLKDDKALTFPAKSALLQKEPKKIVWWQYSAAVAAAILFLFFWNGSQDEYYSPRLTAYTVAKNVSDIETNMAFIVEKGIKNTLQQETVSLKGKSREAKVSPDYKQQVLPLMASEEKTKGEEGTKQLAESNIDQENTSIERDPVVEKDKVTNDKTATTNELADDDYVPIKEFAKEKIKTDLLKGKTFSETIMDELVEASNEKISFKREKDKEGITQKFALNIGKFSISRNK